MNTFRCTKLNKIIIIIWHNVWPQGISLYKNDVQSWRKYQLQFLYLSISMGKQLFIQFKGRSNTSPDLWWFLIWQQRIVRWQLSSKLLYIKKIKQEQKVSSLLSCTGYQSLSRCFMMGWVLNLMETWPNIRNTQTIWQRSICFTTAHCWLALMTPLKNKRKLTKGTVLHPD